MIKRLIIKFVKNRILRGALTSKTVWFGGAVVLTSVLEALHPGMIRAFIPDHLEPVMIPTVGVVIIWLRYLTKRPLEHKEINDQ